MSNYYFILSISALYDASNIIYVILLCTSLLNQNAVCLFCYQKYVNSNNYPVLMALL